VVIKNWFCRLSLSLLSACLACLIGFLLVGFVLPGWLMALTYGLP
jgi:hypothetical protein